MVGGIWRAFSLGRGFWSGIRARIVYSLEGGFVSGFWLLYRDVDIYIVRGGRKLWMRFRLRDQGVPSHVMRVV